MSNFDDRRREIALFRHSVIHELESDGLSRGELSARISELAKRTWRLPSGRERRFTARTLWAWWIAYKSAGLEGLAPRPRKGGPRKLSPDVIEAAIAVRRAAPGRSTTTLIRTLEAQRLAEPGELKRSTLDRHLDRAGASRRRLKALGSQVLPPQRAHPNQLWLGGYHDAPLLWDAKRRDFRAVRLCAFLDHDSKYCVHAQGYTHERVAMLDDTYKRALLKHGIPEKTYVDSSLVSRSGDFAFAVAHIGSELIHSRAYARVAQEDFESLKRGLVGDFEVEARAARIESLEHLNLLFEAWLARSYHLVPHGSTGECPVDRFALKNFTPRYADPALIHDLFRISVRLQVHPKLATVEVEGITFQCEGALRGRWVRALYDPSRLDDVLIFVNDTQVQRAFPQGALAAAPPPASPPSLDLLGAVRAEYDRRIAELAGRMPLAELLPSPAFTLASFVNVCARLLGKELSPAEEEELIKPFGAVPLSEKAVQLVLEHALKLRGRGLHVSVYAHYLKVFWLALKTRRG